LNAHSAERPIASLGEAERAIANLNKITEQLEQTIAEETARVRAGRLHEAVELGEIKADFSRRYASECMRLMSAGALIGRLLPETLVALRKRHAAFQALLHTNLTVLATAHAVSEGIIRGVSGELARRRAPSTYGASGRANAPGARASQPLALSRML